MIAAAVDTLNLGAGLLAMVCLYGGVVSFATSPIIVLWWVADGLRGRLNPMLADRSEGGAFIQAFHVVTTAIVALLVWWWAAS